MKMITSNKIIIYSSSIIVSILLFLGGYLLGNHNSHNNKVTNTIKNLSKKSSIPVKNNIYGTNVGNIIITAQINNVDSQVILVSTASGNQYTFNVNKSTSVFINKKKVSISDLSENNIIRIIGNVQKDGVLVATNVQLISK